MDFFSFNLQFIKIALMGEKEGVFDGKILHINNSIELSCQLIKLINYLWIDLWRSLPVICFVAINRSTIGQTNITTYFKY